MEYLLELGYLGLFIGSFLAATVIPFSADVLLVGMFAVGGDIVLCLMLATLGNWLGGMTSYYIGWLGKWELIEKWFKVSREKLYEQKRRVDKYGVVLALLAWLPIIGDVFAIALGFYKVNAIKSAIYMFIGRLLRFSLWAIIYLWFD